MVGLFVNSLKRFLESRQIGPWAPSYLNGTVAFLDALGRALDGVGGQAVMLDVGCGWEDCYAKKARLGSKISRLLGIDIREDLNNNPSLDLTIRADAYALPFASAQYDVALSDFVLEHLEQPECAFSEIARVLKPGGWLVSRTPNLYHYVPIAALLLRKMGYRPTERFSADGERHEIFPTFDHTNTCCRLKWLARRTGFAAEEMILAQGALIIWSSFCHFV